MSATTSAPATAPAPARPVRRPRRTLPPIHTLEKLQETLALPAVQRARRASQVPVQGLGLVVIGASIAQSNDPGLKRRFVACCTQRPHLVPLFVSLLGAGFWYEIPSNARPNREQLERHWRNRLLGREQLSVVGTVLRDTGWAIQTTDAIGVTQLERSGYTTEYLRHTGSAAPRCQEDVFVSSRLVEGRMPLPGPQRLYQVGLVPLRPLGSQSDDLLKVVAMIQRGWRPGDPVTV
jgi:hypothetical protein